MNKRLIWGEGDDFTGWCCSHCTWGLTAPHLDSTVAALAFNRNAQESLEKRQMRRQRTYSAHREPEY